MQYRSGTVGGTKCQWFPKNLPANLATHVNYAFAFLNTGALRTTQGLAPPTNPHVHVCTPHMTGSCCSTSPDIILSLSPPPPPHPQYSSLGTLINPILGPWVLSMNER